MTTVQLDDLDRRLIDILAHDARVSNRKIAAELGVTEGTVRGRIKRLQQERLIAFTAITSFSLEGANKLCIIGIQADTQNVRQVAEQVAAVPSINAVMVAMGRFNILAFCLIDEIESLMAIASDQVLALPGVRHVETSIAVRTVKYNPRIVRITSSSPDEGNDAD